MPLGNLVFCIRYFLKTKRNPAKKTLEQCLLGKTKPTCQNLAVFDHFQNSRKIKGTFLPAAFQLYLVCMLLKFIYSYCSSSEKIVCC